MYLFIFPWVLLYQTTFQNAVIGDFGASVFSKTSENPVFLGFCCVFWHQNKRITNKKWNRTERMRRILHEQSVASLEENPQKTNLSG